MKDWVGPVLESGEVATALIAAARTAGDALVVQDHGSYVRLLAPQRCVISRLAVEKALGRPFRLPGDLEAVMPSFKGVFHVTSDQAEWSFREAV